MKHYLEKFVRRKSSTSTFSNGRGTTTTLNVLTAGSPRVGNAAFAKLFNSFVDTSIRIVNDLDPIPMVPPSFFGWRHVKGLVMITHYGHLRKDPLFIERSLRKHVFLFQSIPCLFQRSYCSCADVSSSHKIKLYIASLRTVFDVEQNTKDRSMDKL